MHTTVYLLGLAIISSVPALYHCQQLAQNATADICAEAMTCGNCITRDPSCAWCGDDIFSGVRCDYVMSLQIRSCSNITFPSGSLNITQAQNLADADTSPTGQAVQVTPQEARITLKVGEPQVIRLQVRLAKDYPLDLYYLMDLSNSLRLDLKNVANLGVYLERELKKLTADLQLGFGSFVDKTTSPFTTNIDTCEADSCCFDCDVPFGFKNQLPLTTDTGRFSERVAELKVSTSIDSPEGGLDALLQVAVCKEQIGWRNRARRMIVFATDAGFHMAGDGKLAGISKPNDGECHLDPVTNEYTKSTDQDFPSIGQINAKFQKKNIVPVFAVDERKYNLYLELRQLIEGTKVGILAPDSVNVVRLVTNAYRQITSEVNVGDTSPDNIDISYTSYCVGQGAVPGSSKCTDLLLQEVVEFDVKIMAKDCSPDGGQQTFTIRPFGFDESLTVTADVICSCDCESKGVKDRSLCSGGNGTFTCGQCQCDEGRYGTECECDGDSGTDAEDLSSCIRQNSTNVCQLRGQCICGQCACSNPEYFGQHCECDYNCEEFQGLPCGGEERGDCNCDTRTLKRECRCKPDYYGSACECVTSRKDCETINGLLCNGWGNCTCEGKCQCETDSPFRGSKCDECPTCVGQCSSFQDCVLCQVFDKGPFTGEQCDMCKARITLVDDVKKLSMVNDTDFVLCEYRDDDNCTILYTYQLQDNGSYTVLVQSEKVCVSPKDGGRRTQVPWIWIIIGIIAGILLLGIFIIALIRLWIFIQERREYAKFEQERKGAGWNKSDNPLFKPSTTTVMNPMHGKALE
ncbi:integrin beta-1-like isoform X2 [Amphiura filiformis]|uniref:integrin beta-1-like isoform X2 n=1 Tax=Amphiura filiformis TaxID=82378 RepID=UPI003B22846F